MIELSRREAGRFRVLARRCVVGRPRGPSPPVYFRQASDALTLSIDLGEVVLHLRLPSGAGNEVALRVPLALLDAVAGNDPAACRIEVDASGRIHARWTDGRQSREAVYDSATAEERPALPDTRPRLRPVDASFLTALHECGRTTAREGVRYAFSRLQLKGKEGKVLATDGRQLLVWSGFELPFADRVLVPAIPAFGSRELAMQESVRVGRSGGRILVEAGSWAIGLTIDTGAKFPDTESLLARSGDAAGLRLSVADAAAILGRLDSVRSEKPPTVTVDIGPRASVVLAGTRIAFLDSESTGKATVAVQAQHLQRAMQLGLRNLRTDRAGGTVLFEDERRSYLVSTVSPEAFEVADSSVATVPSTSLETISHEGGSSMPSIKNGHPSTEPSDGDDVLDPVAEAEALKVALAEAGRHGVGRLLMSLRQIHKQRWVLETGWSSLKQLGLGAQGGAMSLNLSAHFGDLALTLGDLQRRFRSAARLEVGHAVGEALRQFGVAAICGPVVASRRAGDSSDDPWQSPETWPQDDFAEHDGGMLPSHAAKLARIQAIVLLGISGARWAYLHTRHPAAAVAVGLVLVLVGLLGGRSADALLEVWSSANALLRDAS